MLQRQSSTVLRATTACKPHQLSTNVTSPAHIAGENHMDTLELTDQDPLELLYESVRAQRRLLSGFGGNPKVHARSG